MGWRCKIIGCVFEVETKVAMGWAPGLALEWLYQSRIRGMEGGYGAEMGGFGSAYVLDMANRGVKSAA